LFVLPQLPLHSARLWAVSQPSCFPAHSSGVGDRGRNENKYWSALAVSTFIYSKAWCIQAILSKSACHPDIFGVWEFSFCSYTVIVQYAVSLTTLKSQLWTASHALQWAKSKWNSNCMTTTVAMWTESLRSGSRNSRNPTSPPRRRQNVRNFGCKQGLW
ncbi:hypothetical protein AGOR_G00102500, partial [Albula goreensis]